MRCGFPPRPLRSPACSPAWWSANCFGGGYFTRQLSDIVGPKGKVYGMENLEWGVPDDQKMAAEPGHGNVTIIPTKFSEIAPPEKLDLFWITQNYHDLHIAKFGTVDLLRAQQARVRCAEARRHLFHSGSSGEPRHDRSGYRHAAPDREGSGDPRSDRGRVQAGGRRHLPASHGRRSHQIDLRQGDPGHARTSTR